MKCTRPVKVSYKKNGLEHTTMVNCGYCTNCRINKISNWIIRIKSEESGCNTPSTFLTLTYTDEKIPTNNSLRKLDLQNFHKELRKKGFKFKFLSCGEYGDTTDRPHYHGIYVGLKADERQILEIWRKGQIKIGTVTDASIRYVASYLMKNTDEIKYRIAMEQEPPFMLSSKKWGLEWLRESYNKLLRDKYITYNGKKIPLPKYLKDKYPELKRSELDGRWEWIRKNKEILKNDINKTSEIRRIELKALTQMELKQETREKRKGNKSL